MKRIKLIATAMLMGFVLAGCDARTEDQTNRFIIPQELAEKGCKLFAMRNDSGTVIYTMYCPNATTSTTNPGKSTTRSLVVDDSSQNSYTGSSTNHY